MLSSILKTYDPYLDLHLEESHRAQPVDKERVREREVRERIAYELFMVQGPRRRTEASTGRETKKNRTANPVDRPGVKTDT